MHSMQPYRHRKRQVELAITPVTILLFGDGVLSCLWVRDAVDTACSNQNSICPAQVAPHGFGAPARCGIGRAHILQWQQTKQKRVPECKLCSFTGCSKP